MKAGILLAFLLTCVVMTAPSVAADTTVDGKWEAKVKTQVGEQTIRMTFKGDGDKLTGTVSNGQSSETAIEDGKIDGGTISFKQTIDVGGTGISFTYIGRVGSDQITFTREPFKMEFTAKRVK